MAFKKTIVKSEEVKKVEKNVTEKRVKMLNSVITINGCFWKGNEYTFTSDKADFLIKNGEAVEC